MKYLSLIIFILFSRSIFSQTAISDTSNLQIVNISALPDTLSGVNKYKLSFKLKIQDIVNLKSIELSVLDENDVVLNSIGNYALKLHPNGFYYLETSSNQKRTVLNNEVFFTVILDPSSYNVSRKIQKKDTSKLNTVKNTSYLIPR